MGKWCWKSARSQKCLVSSTSARRLSLDTAIQGWALDWGYLISYSSGQVEEARQRQDDVFAMRFSLSAVTALLLVSSGFVSGTANANAEAKPDTTPNSAPTSTARQVKARQTTPNLLGSLYQLANAFDLRACIPAALPLVTALPKIPPALIAGDAISQALSQTTRGIEDVCDFSITGSVGDTFTSFLPTWYSWYNRYSDRIASIVTKCSDAGGLVRTVEAYETCPQVVAQITAASASATGTSTSTTDTDTGTALSTTTTTTAATESSEMASMESPGTAGETGFLGAAAAAAAGVLGIVAVL
ncbi:hypothetical protein CIB48_g3296 [Xylaria polymorpha]|nr:hypothetical protein CIB48_g3296 [Xylaria polymorpha]